MKTTNHKIYTINAMSPGQPQPQPRHSHNSHSGHAHHRQPRHPTLNLPPLVYHQHLGPVASISPMVAGYPANFRGHEAITPGGAFEPSGSFVFVEAASPPGGVGCSGGGRGGSAGVCDRFKMVALGEGKVPVRKRSCHDCIFAMAFIAFIGFLAYVIVDIATSGKARPAILLKGYDSFGNICGEENDAIVRVPSSGLNMTQKPLLMITLESNTSLRTACVSKCPANDFLLTAFNRCLPKKSQFALPLQLLDAINVSRSTMEAIVADASMSWKEITYSVSISFVFSLIVLIMLRYVASLVIWTSLIALLLVGALGVTYVWLKWNIAHQRHLSVAAENIMYRDFEKSADNWFYAAIGCTICWTLFVLVLLVMRKRIQLAGSLFREAGKAIACMPFILLQPFWTFTVLMAACGSWLVGLILLQSARHPVIDAETGHVTYQLPSFYKNMKLYHIFAIIWTVHFILACQHYIIAGSVTRWYFRRGDKDRMRSPIARTFWQLLRYHLGSIALGALFVASIKMCRLIFKRLEAILAKYQHSCSMCGKLCYCCLWIFEKVLIYINRNVYVEIAIYGESFCKSARRAFRVISANALRVSAVNSVGDFLLFVSKLIIVLATQFVAAKLVEDREQQLTYTWAPLVVSGCCAYFVAHCFLSVYEMAIDTLLVCFCEDCVINDGLSRPYFMSKTLEKLISGDGHKSLLDEQN